MNTVHIPTVKGELVEVECFGEFDYVVDGQAFRFVITRDVNNDGIGKCITHKASGKRVGGLGVSAAYLKKYSKAADDVARARIALDELIGKRGAARARSVLAAAELP